MENSNSKIISLDGKWKATDNITTDLDFVRRDYNDSAWVDIDVPGHWQENPAFEAYPEKLIYRRKFSASKPSTGTRVFLRFSGVFYFCRVWCNGKYLGEHSGYFAPFEYDITDVVDEENTLAVFARCEIEKDTNDKRQVLGVFANWDCKPDSIQPGGIWNSVELIEKGPLSLEHIEVGEFELSAGEDATAIVKGIVEGPPKAQYSDLKIAWEIIPHNFDGETLQGEILVDAREAYETAFAFEVSITDVALWWPAGLGDQNLYDIKLSLVCAEDEMDSTARRFGVRILEMYDFILAVNGRRVFCRGSNYAPGDIRLARADRSIYERDVDMMLAVNLNMIRVHAHVERPEFYDVCDEKGLMVFQDFPLQWYYSKSVTEEAVEQAGQMASLLRNHPCVTIWCCHNEPFVISQQNSVAEAVTANKLQDLAAEISSNAGGNWNKDVLDPKLEEAVRAVDADRPVIRHSGIIGLVSGGTDTHLYFGWYYGTMRLLKGLPAFHKKSMRFVTEYGAQAYPAPRSFAKMQDAASLEGLDWEELQRKYMLQKKIMDKFVPVKKGGTLEEYIEVSQWYQARLIQYYNEFLRRHKYDPCGGAVHFLFNDCCPAVTWSVVDYWRESKRGYEALRDSFRPLLAVAGEFPKRWYPRGETVSTRLYVINDTLETYPGAEVHWAFFNEDGDCMAEGIKVLDVTSDSVSTAGRARWDSAGAKAGGYALVVELRPSGAGEPITNQYEFELRKRGRKK